MSEEQEEDCGEVVSTGSMHAQLRLQRANHQAKMTLQSPEGDGALE